MEVPGARFFADGDRQLAPEPLYELPHPLPLPAQHSGSAAKRDSNDGPRSGPTFALRQLHPVVLRPLDQTYQPSHVVPRVALRVAISLLLGGGGS